MNALIHIAAYLLYGFLLGACGIKYSEPQFWYLMLATIPIFLSGLYSGARKNR